MSTSFSRSLVQRARSRSSSVRGDTIVALTTALGCAAVLGEAYLRTDLGDAQSAEACSYGPTTSLVGDGHVRRLERNGLVVIEGALSGEALLGARADIQRYRRAGKSSSGGGTSMAASANSTCNANDAKGAEGDGSSSDGFEGHGNEDDVRQDMIAWLRRESQDDSNGDSSDDTSTCAPVTAAAESISSASTQATQPIGIHLAHCIDLIRGVAHTLESRNYRGSHSHRVPLQCQLALYRGDGKSGYARHLDRCDGKLSDLGLLEWLRLSDYRSRAVTAILYLNDPERTPEHGGALRCWLRVDSSDEGGNRRRDESSSAGGPTFEPPLGIQPTGGTLLIFDSDRLEHMVLPSSADRYALTVWISGEQNEITAT